MLWGTVLWAIAHLFANGDLRSLLLFGTFLVWALFDMWSADRRGAYLSEQRVAWYYELAVAVVGVIAYAFLARSQSFRPAFCSLLIIVFAVAATCQDRGFRTTPDAAQCVCSDVIHGCRDPVVDARHS